MIELVEKLPQIKKLGETFLPHGLFHIGLIDNFGHRRYIQFTPDTFGTYNYKSVLFTDFNWPTASQPIDYNQMMTYLREKTQKVYVFHNATELLAWGCHQNTGD